jgi:CheY-like chemotaxis protein
MSTDQRILVVDDEPDTVDSCVRIPRWAGFGCVSATDPHRALALFEFDRPDLLLMPMV